MMPNFQMVRGVPFVNVHWCKKDNIEKTMDYVPQNGDIIIASYPRTGTNWLQYIVLQITSRGEYLPSYSECVHKIFPTMEVTGPEAIDNMKGLRMYKHHCRYDMVQKNPKSKVLYIYRNPADTLVSWYYFLQDLLKEEMDFDEYFERFLTGDVEYGSYFENVLSYLVHKEDDNLLLISYEKLHANRKEEILRIAKFLGEEYYQSLSGDESLLGKILEHISFDYMKKNVPTTLPRNEISNDSKENSERFVNHFRKGTVGDGKRSMSMDQLKRLQNKVVEKMKDTDLLKEWIGE